MVSRFVEFLALGPVVIGAALVAIVGLFGLIGVFVKRRKQARLHRSTPVSPASTPETGYALVEGHIEPGKSGQITSLLTEQPCLGYRFQVQQRDPDAGWWDVVDGGDLPNFQLVGPDETMTALTGGADPMIDSGWKTIEVPAGEAPPNEICERLETSLIDTAALALTEAVDDPRRFRESVIESGDSLFVYGEVRGGEYIERRIEVDPQQEYTVGTIDPDAIELETVGEDSTLTRHVLRFGTMVIIGGIVTIVGASQWF